jgi:beta-glucosidase
MFPQAIGMAETWDSELLRAIGAVEGEETRYVAQSPKYGRGGLVVRAPNADLGRDPRWGRTEECYGEDPFFNGTLAVAFIQGLQGDHPRYWRAASLLKHFLANSNEDDRSSSSSNFDERLFREYYSVPFRKGIVEGGADAFMAAYNAVNGVPCTVNPFLRDVTMREWGEDGIICTDGGALRLLVTAHKLSPGMEEAAAASIKAGINQFLDRYADAVQGAVKRGLLSEREIDGALRGVFRVMLRLGLLDPPALVPYSRIGEGEAPWLSDKHKAAARLVTQKSIVLLKNSGGVLPLDPGKLKSVAVIGRRANEVLLDWYSGTPPYTVTPLEGLKKRLGPAVSVGYATDNTGDAAVALARSSNVAIVVVGNHPTCDAGWAVCPLPSDGKEAVDRKSITLEQEELVRQVYAANPRTVVVLVASFPFAINWTQANVPAIVHMTHNSQEMGNALADVLLGDVNPAGRLVQTWPKSLDQVPPMMDYDIRHGRTYMYFKGEPLYPFGHGLSYTTFRYSNLRLGAASFREGQPLSVSVDVENAGGRGGDEVVQMYVRHVDSTVERPQKELRGFKRVTLAPKEKQTVTLFLRAEDLSYWDEGRKVFVIEKGKVELLVGASSADIRLRRVVAVSQSGFVAPAAAQPYGPR